MFCGISWCLARTTSCHVTRGNRPSGYPIGVEALPERIEPKNLNMKKFVGCAKKKGTSGTLQMGNLGISERDRVCSLNHKTLNNTNK